MRSALFVAAATAAGLVAAAVPAQAAITPHCTTYLVATSEGDSSSCTTPWPNADGLVVRRFDFHVSSGAVLASMTCGTSTKSVVMGAPLAGAIEMVQPRFSSCTHTLTALTPVASAAGVSTYYVTYV